MSIFATEFPVRPKISNQTFVALALTWIRGIKKSSVLNQLDGSDSYDDDVAIRSKTGETLQFKTYEDEKIDVIGVRHELPDDLGRIWRTECVLSRTLNENFLRCLVPEGYVVI